MYILILELVFSVFIYVRGEEEFVQNTDMPTHVAYQAYPHGPIYYVSIKYRSLIFYLFFNLIRQHKLTRKQNNKFFFIPQQK